MNFTHLKRLKSLHRPANPSELLKDRALIRKTVIHENKAFTSDPGCTSTAKSAATPTPSTATPSLHLGLQPPLGAGSQPDQVWAESIAAAVEFEDEYSIMGFDGLFDSVFGEI